MPRRPEGHAIGHFGVNSAGFRVARYNTAQPRVWIAIEWSHHRKRWQINVQLGSRETLACLAGSRDLNELAPLFLNYVDEHKMALGARRRVVARKYGGWLQDSLKWAPGEGFVRQPVYHQEERGR